ncbi:MAG: tetratricopeptide repeat protein [Candidatus Acidiferrales bacterium]
MRTPNARLYLLLFLPVIFFLTTRAAAAQSDANAAYNAERANAVNLINAQKFMEALPLFEDLAVKRPNDDQVLLGLATCLLSHSATLSDPDAAGKERTRAKNLLLEARDLGNESPLLQNLLQMLQGLPEQGPIKYSENAAVDEAMRAGESAFAQNGYDEAIKNYSHALELDPKNSTAALFVGDSYFGKKDYANAGVWYSRASEIDPDAETPYRYYADMLTKMGDMDGARTKAIQAVVAEPYNPITWRGLAQWATVNHVQLVAVRANVPSNVKQEADNKITITVPSGQKSDSTAAWLAYSMEQALWRGDKFKKEYPQETEYRHSLPEEAGALKLAAKTWIDLTGKKGASKPADADLDLLVKIYQADMIEPYVLLSAPDEGIAKDYEAYREKNRSKLEQYLGQFVVPPAPPKP